MMDTNEVNDLFVEMCTVWLVFYGFITNILVGSEKINSCKHLISYTPSHIAAPQRFYNSSELKTLCKVGQHQTRSISADLKQTLTDLGIFHQRKGRNCKQGRKRGKRGGRIRPRIKESNHGVNVENLINIKCHSVQVSKRGTKPSKTLTIGLMNCQSVCNKTDEIVEYIKHMKLDIVALTETWLKGNDSDQKTVGELQTSGLTVSHAPRTHRSGGGVGIMYPKTVKLDKHPKFEARSFENFQITVHSGGSSIRVAIIYRLHPTKKNGLESSDFFQEFAVLVDTFATQHGHLLILGDFNIHWDCPHEPDTKHLMDILHSANMVQHVQEPTHRLGHIIDLVASRQDDPLVKQVSVSSMISDHAIISITVSLQKPQVPVKTLRYRKYRSIDTKAFQADLMESALITDSINNLDQLIKLYDITIQNLIDKHAPVQSKELSCRSTNPWCSRDIQAAKRYRRYCERLVKRTKLTVRREMFVAARTQVRELISTAKAQYYNNKIVECNGSQKTVFSVVNKVLHRDDMIQLHSNLMKILHRVSIISFKARSNGSGRT